MTKCIVAFVGILSLAVTIVAQHPAGARRGGVVAAGTAAPWAISDDERIARRQNETARHQARSVNGTSRKFTESINGREHPELLLTYELFDNLIYGLRADQALSANAHKLYDARIRSYFGYDASRFWNTLHEAAGAYADSLDTAGTHPGRADFVASSGKTLWVPISRELCSARISSLQDARRLFGSADFDRFLYVVVAPEIRYSAGGTVTNADREAQLRYMLGGCK